MIIKLLLAILDGDLKQVMTILQDLDRSPQYVLQGVSTYVQYLAQIRLGLPVESWVHAKLHQDIPPDRILYRLLHHASQGELALQAYLAPPKLILLHTVVSMTCLLLPLNDCLLVPIVRRRIP